jgi:hypothetical protein
LELTGPAATAALVRAARDGFVVRVTLPGQKATWTLTGARPVSFGVASHRVATAAITARLRDGREVSLDEIVAGEPDAFVGVPLVDLGRHGPAVFETARTVADLRYAVSDVLAAEDIVEVQYAAPVEFDLPRCAASLCPIPGYDVPVSGSLQAEIPEERAVALREGWQTTEAQLHRDLAADGVDAETQAAVLDKTTLYLLPLVRTLVGPSTTATAYAPSNGLIAYALLTAARPVVYRDGPLAVSMSTTTGVDDVGDGFAVARADTQTGVVCVDDNGEDVVNGASPCAQELMLTLSEGAIGAGKHSLTGSATLSWGWRDGTYDDLAIDVNGIGMVGANRTLVQGWQTHWKGQRRLVSGDDVPSCNGRDSFTTLISSGIIDGGNSAVRVQPYKLVQRYPTDSYHGMTGYPCGGTAIDCSMCKKTAYDAWYWYLHWTMSGNGRGAAVAEFEFGHNRVTKAYQWYCEVGWAGTTPSAACGYGGSIDQESRWQQDVPNEIEDYAAG